MDGAIIRFVWWLQKLNPADAVLAACLGLLVVAFYQLAVMPVMERVHRNTWL